MTALSGEPALFLPGSAFNSPIAPGDIDRLIPGYRLTQTAMLGDPYCTVLSTLRARLALVSPSIDRRACSYFYCLFFRVNTSEEMFYFIA